LQTVIAKLKDEMSKVWQMVALSEILTPVSRPESVDPQKDYRLLGARWYAGGLYVKETKPGSQIQAAKLYRVEENDFVYNRLFAWKGSFAIATGENAGCYVSNEFPSFAINPEIADGHYLWRYFSRAITWDEALGLSTGGTPTSRNRLKEEKLLAMKIPLPSLDEQQRIVARIEELATKIEEARSLRQESAESVFALIASLHLNLSGERIVGLEDFLRLDEEREEIEYGKEYPQVGVKGFGQGLFARETLSASQTTYKAFNRLYEGAVVLSQVKGWEGALAVCPSDLAGRYVSPEYRTFRCIPEEALPKYLDAIFSTPWFWTQLSSLSRGVGGRRERIRPEHFLSLEIPMPKVAQQKQAASAFEALEKVRSLQIESAAELDSLLPAILDKAFKGEL
jgi:type I restriction enzyme S subunit